MRKPLRLALLVSLVFVEIILLAGTLKYPIPHRQSEMAAFAAYIHNPTPELKNAWLKERSKTDREVSVRRTIAASLAILDAVAIVALLLGVRNRTGGTVNRTQPIGRARTASPV